MLEGGLPPGVLNIVTGPGAVVGDEIIRHPLVRKIGFTGETGTGKQVARAAADELKHVTLELGGSDAAIVCADADLDLAARNIAIGRFFNAGQACLAIKRVFVVEAWRTTDRRGRGARQAVEAGQRHRRERRRWGRCTPKSSAPRSSRSSPMRVERGGKVVAGGGRPTGGEFDKGFYFKPTVVVDVPDGARVWTEETFGPLLPIMRVKDLDEALEKANASSSGSGRAFSRAI